MSLPIRLSLPFPHLVLLVSSSFVSSRLSRCFLCAQCLATVNVILLKKPQILFGLYDHLNIDQVLFASQSSDPPRSSLAAFRLLPASRSSLISTSSQPHLLPILCPSSPPHLVFFSFPHVNHSHTTTATLQTLIQCHCDLRFNCLRKARRYQTLLPSLSSSPRATRYVKSERALHTGHW